MTQKKAEDKPVVVTKQEAAVPANLPLGLIPVYIWWKENGSRFLMNVAVVLIIVGAAFGYREWRNGRDVSANAAFLQANSVGEFEDFVATYGSMKIGNAMRLRLARAYFDAGKYEEALDVYEACLKKGAPEGFAGTAQLGRAHALEAMGSLDEANAAYRQFVEANAKHFLAWKAQMGLARVLALQGKKQEAQNLLEVLKAEKTDERMAVEAIDQLAGVINRYEPRAARSLFDLAEEAAKALAVPVAPATGTEETP